MISGIALLDGLPFRVQCTAQLKRGDGDIYISGPVDDLIEETINESIGFANTICDHESIAFPNLANHNLLIRIGLPNSSAPIIGPSLGLLLGLQIVAAFTGRSYSYESFVTGELKSNGDVFAVGGIAAKRKGAAELGGQRLILPASQLDFFSKDIIQIPVSSIFEAYALLSYDKTKR